MIEEGLNEYIDNTVRGLDPYLDAIERKTHLEYTQSHMISGRLQAAFLKMIVQLTAARNILELGTFSGYACLAMAEGLPGNGKITTLEVIAEIGEKAQINIDGSKYASKVNLVIGEAKEILPTLLKTERYDLIFIDADKKSNKYYYDLILDTHPRGTLILIDNVLWKGRVMDEEVKDAKTNAIKEFIVYVMDDIRVESFILPIRDGIYMVRIK
jgi:caffeoyl-CoA O-methyltransferase